MTNKTLVCYFSVTNTTKKVAIKLAEYLNSSLFEIKPTIPYSNKDLDWEDGNSRSSIEMNDENNRPTIVNKIDDIDQYDLIVIGFPIWWNLPPRIINSFIEENNLANKKIFLFATSGGSGINNSYNQIKNKYEKINIVNYKKLYSFSNKNDFKKLMLIK